MSVNQPWNATPQGQTCPSCGATLEPGASFCVMCGTSVKGAEAPMASPLSTCQNCGAALEPGMSFCVMCGAPVPPTGATAPEPAPLPHVAPPLPVAAPMPIAAPVPAKTCPVCGAELEPNASFCVMCGNPISPGASSASVTPEVVSYDSVSFDSDSSHQNIAAVPTDGFEEDDDPTVHPILLTLTYEEARSGCRKQVRIDGEQVSVDIPAGVDANTKFDIPNKGYYDEMTGRRGPLRICFYLI